MNKLEIPSTGSVLMWPSSWEECTQRQIRHIFRLTPHLLSGKIDLTTYKLALFYALTGLRMANPELGDRHLTTEQRMEKYDNIRRACETIGFMFDHTEDGKTVFSYNEVNCQIPYLTVRGRKWMAPAPALTGMTFGEYRMAMDQMMKYRSGIKEAGNTMMAILYRPVRMRSGMRIPFDADECSRRGRKLAIANDVVFYAATWLASCDRFLKTQNFEVEGHTVNLSCLFRVEDNESEGETESLGLIGVQLALAESGTFGDMEGVDRANLYTVLLKLYQWKKEHDKIRKK